jgi:phospholipid transport system substrate-binding protein
MVVKVAWKNNMRRFFGLMLVLLWLYPLLAAAQQDPVELVKTTSERVLAEVRDHKKELNESPGKIYPMVEEIVLPRFDFQRMSQLVLGKHWRKATPDQRKAFVMEFRELLVRTYATALLNYSGQEIEYPPIQWRPEDGRVMVKTLLRENGAPSLPIDYKLYLKEGEWKVYDVVIDNLSLVSNYRSNYSSKIRRHKLSGLIKMLAERNQQDK